MPVFNVVMADVTDITYSAGGGTEWQLAVKAQDDATVLGTYDALSDGFAAGTDIGTPRAVAFHFEAIGPNPAVLNTETFIIEFDSGGSLTIYPNAIGSEVIKYADSNGVLYNNANSEIFSFGEVLNEPQYLSENVENLAYVESLESLATTEDDPYGVIGTVTEEQISLVEESDQINSFETFDLLKLTEQNEKESFSELEDTLTIVEERLDVEFSVAYNDVLQIAMATKQVGEELSIQEVITDVLKFTEKGLKYVSWVEVHGSLETDCWVAFDYRYKEGDTNVWGRTPYVILNNEGVARISIVGIELRLVFKAKDFTKAQPDKFRIGFSMVDRRYTRGQSRGFNQD